MKTSETTKELWKALFAAQAEMPTLEKEGVNPHFRSKYITLDTLWPAVKPILHKHGLLLFQSPLHTDTMDAGRIGIQTNLIHAESGEWVESDLVLPLDKITPQAAGSALTYARRYSLTAMLGIVAETDDDGERAMNHNAPSRPAMALRPPAEPKPPVRKRVGTTPQDGESYDQYEAKPIGVEGARAYLGRWEKMGIDSEAIRSTINKHFDGLNTAKLSNAQILSLDAMLIKQQEEQSAVS